MTDQRLAMTTGQAARCCLVTADTIVNWIKAGRLPAQRTAGGQYRILRRDLRSFMRAQGMNTDLLVDPADVRPMCWEFHAGADGQPPAACAGCLVKYLGVRDCFKLMGMRPDSSAPRGRCEDCEYYRRWADPESSPERER